MTIADSRSPLIAEDVFRLRIAETISALETWAASQGDVADITIDAQSSFWSLTVAPFAFGACPFALVITTDQQFDIEVAGDVYRDRPIANCALITDLVDGIAAGRVHRLTSSCNLTGARRAVAVQISVAAETWSASHDGWNGAANIPGQTAKAKCFVPYRRGAANA